VSEETWSNWITTTTRRCTSSDELGILDILEKKFLYIPETVLINSLSKQFTRRLRTVSFKLWHVNIIDKEDFAGASDFRSKLILTFLVKIALESILQVPAGSLTRKVDKSRIDSLAVSFHHEVFGNN